MKSSINIQPVKSGSEKHNNREQELNYVRSDLSHLNSSFNIQSISDCRKSAEENCKSKTGRSMQAKATPIREAVLLIKENHSAADLKSLGDQLQERFGIKTIQAYCHKDEGHYDKKTNEWKPNLHGHMVFDWTDHNTGKSIKLDQKDMVEMQTMVASHLGMERGEKSSKVHLDSIEFKTQKAEEDLKLVYKVDNILPKAIKVIQQAKSLQEEIKTLTGSKNGLETQIKEQSEKLEEVNRAIQERNKTTEEIKKLQEQKKALQIETDLTRMNLKYVENKTVEARKELTNVQEQKKNKGMRM